MSSLERPLAIAVFVSLWSMLLCAQESTVAQVVIAGHDGKRMRFTSTATVAQMRLEVFSTRGKPLFDSGWRDGDVLDWPADSANETYRCRISVRDLKGDVTEKEIVLLEGDGPRMTLLAHDGTNGAVVTTSGDLSFRFGNFLAGTDQEAMRLTAGGELVLNGLVRARGGIAFDDGTVLRSASAVAASRSLIPGTAASPRPPLKPRANTFPPAFQFVVGDTGVNVGTTNPSYALDVTGDINTASTYKIGGILFAHDFGGTYLGLGAGNTMTGFDNTGVGQAALTVNTSGYHNTATGYYALSKNTSGYGNTAGGSSAMFLTTTGNSNTAWGFNSLYNNTTGNTNAATGTSSLYHNVDGSANVADGDHALFTNTSGSNNVAVGNEALYSSTGGQNVAIGFHALHNTTSNFSVAIGYNALAAATSGDGNIAIGPSAGVFTTTGHQNIYLGHPGDSTDDAVIRIGYGPFSQNKTYIDGIYGATTSGQGYQVFIDSTGQLGTASSSRSVKFDIEDMGNATENLSRLRPVTFRYLAHGANAPLQYGLIAEEVAEVYPELIGRDRNGEPSTVLYQFLAPMLLNEVQKQRCRIEEQEKTIATLQATLTAVEERLRAIERKTQ